VDRDFLQWGAQFIGLAGAAFWGGMKGGKRAFKELRHEVKELRADFEWLCNYLESRFGKPITPRPKNGATADLGLADSPPKPQTREAKERN
jgi:hypothetical protein